MMKRLVKKIFIGLLVLGFSTNLFARAAAYQVEMIIFSHLTPEGIAQEQWPLITPPNDFQNASEIPALPVSAFIMQREQLDFKRNPGYNVLLHTAWSQPNRGSGPLLHVQGDGVNGTIRISVDRYFDVRFNLYFAVSENTLASIGKNGYFKNSSNLVYFHLKETRRMKSHEMNYIDNPLFGVLIKIVPEKAS